MPTLRHAYACRGHVQSYMLSTCPLQRGYGVVLALFLTLPPSDPKRCQSLARAMSNWSIWAVRGCRRTLGRSGFSPKTLPQLVGQVVRMKRFHAEGLRQAEGVQPESRAVIAWVLVTIPRRWI